MRPPSETERTGLLIARDAMQAFVDGLARQPLTGGQPYALKAGLAAIDWIDDALARETVELLIDVDDTSEGMHARCIYCDGNNGFGSCKWYDLFDIPDGAPEFELVIPLTRTAPELCPLRDPRRAVLVRRLP